MQPNTGSMRYCLRCGAELHGTAEDQPHVCKDIARRLARRERQVQAVMVILDAATLEGGLYVAAGDRVLAEDIVKRLAGLGVADD